eukprot:gene33772-45225_t
MSAQLSPHLLLAVPLAPLVGAIAAGFFGKVIGRSGAHTVTILGVLVAFILSAMTLQSEIFGRRARTKEGVLQVELARLEYEKSRLVRTWTHLERQRGGTGNTGGPGETQIELDRRQIADRIIKMKKDLVEVRRTRALHRSQRKKVGLVAHQLNLGAHHAGEEVVRTNQVHGGEAGIKQHADSLASMHPHARNRHQGAVRLVGAATFALGSGALIDVQSGTFVGSSNANEVWTNNLADLNVASGAFFNGVEGNIRVDVLAGSGTIRSGLAGAGYQNFTFGVDQGSGTFAGVLANTDGANLGNFVKTGSGTQILTGASTFTIIRVHVLGNVLGPIFVYATSLISVSMILASGLSFLGLGVKPPEPEWGLMLNTLRTA